MTVKLADAEAILAAAPASGKTAAVAYGWNYARLRSGRRRCSRPANRPRHVDHRLQVELPDRAFSGRAGYGSVDVGGFEVEVEVGDVGRGGRGRRLPLRAALDLLGLGLWLAPAEPEDVFARADPSRTAATSTSTPRSGSPTA